jgi:hypothetical protein
MHCEKNVLIFTICDEFEAAVSNLLEGNCIPRLGTVATDELIGHFPISTLYQIVRNSSGVCVGGSECLECLISSGGPCSQEPYLQRHELPMVNIL